MINDNAEKLLQEARKFVNDNYIIKRNSGGDFNIFSVLNIERDEVFTHSNMIYSFLCSESGHCMEDKYLKLFLKNVLDIKEPYLLKKWYIEREWPFNDGRIDFIIYNDDYFIAIEMKIDATDQIKQLKRYEEYAKTKTKNYAVYYLTLDGKKPSSQSIDGMESEVSLISFKEHIINWLQSCIDITPKQYKVLNALYQYKELINKIINNQKGVENEMISLLMNKDNYIAFKELQKSENAMKQKFMDKFCAALETKFKYNNMDFQKNANIEDFYDNPKSIIEYERITDKTFITEENILYSIVHIVEISEADGSLVYGYKLKNSKTNKFITSMEKELSQKDKELLKAKYNFKNRDLKEIISGIWICWNYIHAEGNGIYSFRKFNDNVTKMLDEDEFKKEVDRIANTILEEYNLFFGGNQYVNV